MGFNPNAVRALKFTNGSAPVEVEIKSGFFSGTLNAGLITCNITADGTTTGTALVTTLVCVQVTAILPGNNPTAVQIPFASAFLSADKKILTIAGATGKAMLALGDSVNLSTATVYVKIDWQ